jgi:general secretion pathway protein K
MRTSSRRRAGSALLAVLWLSAALAAIAFSLSSTVKGEIERTATASDGLRAYYLATGGVYRAMIELLWSVTGTDPNKRMIPKGATEFTYTFPSGQVRIEFLPEAGKLDVNHAKVEEIARLVLALGVEPGRAQEVAAAIDDWRRAPGQEGVGQFDQYYLGLGSSFRPRHASIEEIEELLAVKGVTPDIFYGTYMPTPGAGGGTRLEARGGLIDCLSVYGTSDRVDANTAPPAVLSAVGLSPFAVSALVERRKVTPLTEKDVTDFVVSIGGDPGRLRVEGISMVTIRATARLTLPDGKLSDLKRTVAAVVKYMPTGADFPVHIVRWYDTAWSL